MSNLFSLINPVRFSQCVSAHLKDLYPELAEQLNIEGHIISVDAMGTQAAIAKTIRQKRLIS